MATSAYERRKQVMTGDLPQDFLRISRPFENNQIGNDQQMAAAMQATQQGFPGFMPATLGRLSITVAQAKLNKNYGLTKMDPYCRIRVGHSVFETHTAHSGGKNPRWNKVIHCHVPTGVDSMYVELFDERAFTTDDRVAWAHVTIPESTFQGETTDEWYSMNGKLGDGKEGMLNIILTYMPPGQAPPPQQIVYASGAPNMQPVVMLPAGMPTYYPPQAPMYQPAPVPAPGYQPMPQINMLPAGGAPVPAQHMMPQQPAQQMMPQQPAQQMMPQQPPQQMMPQQPPHQMMPQHLPQQPPQGPLFTDDDVKQIKDMFPNNDEEVIRSILDANRGNKDRTINHLLAMAAS